MLCVSELCTSIAVCLLVYTVLYLRHKCMCNTHIVYTQYWTHTHTHIHVHSHTETWIFILWVASAIIPTPITSLRFLTLRSPISKNKIFFLFTVPLKPLHTVPSWRSETFYLRLLFFFLLLELLILFLLYFFYSISCLIMRDAIDVCCNEENRHLLFISSISM